MNKLMNFHVSLFCKSFPTEFTFIRFLSGMYSHMFYQSWRSWKPLATKLAGMLIQAHVHFYWTCMCLLRQACVHFCQTWKREQYCKKVFYYCRFGNFCENFISANIFKRHISDVKNSRLRQDLPISIKDSDFPISRRFYFHKTSHMPSLIRGFAGRLNILWILSYWLKTIWSF